MAMSERWRRLRFGGFDGLADFGKSPYRRVRGDSRRSSLGQVTRPWTEIAVCRPSTLSVVPAPFARFELRTIGLRELAVINHRLPRLPAHRLDAMIGFG